MMTLADFLTMTVPEFNYMTKATIKGIDIDDLNMNPTKYQIREASDMEKHVKKPYIKVDTDFGRLVITQSEKNENHLPNGTWKRGAQWSN
jgi:hypothetical protein